MSSFAFVLVLVFGKIIISQGDDVSGASEKGGQCDLGETGKLLNYAHSECYLCPLACMAKDLSWVDEDEQIVIKPILEFFYSKEFFPDSQILLQSIFEDCNTEVKTGFPEGDLCKRLNILSLCAFKKIDEVCPGDNICSGPKPKFSTIDRNMMDGCKPCFSDCHFGRMNWINDEGVLDMEKVTASVPPDSMLSAIMQECEQKYAAKLDYNDKCSYIQDISSCVYYGYQKECNATLWSSWNNVEY